MYAVVHHHWRGCEEGTLLAAYLHGLVRGLLAGCGRGEKLSALALVGEDPVAALEKYHKVVLRHFDASFHGLLQFVKYLAEI